MTADLNDSQSMATLPTNTSEPTSDLSDAVRLYYSLNHPTIHENLSKFSCRVCRRRFPGSGFRDDRSRVAVPIQRHTENGEGCAMRTEIFARMINILPDSFMWFFPVSAIHRSMEINRIKSLHN